MSFVIDTFCTGFSRNTHGFPHKPHGWRNPSFTDEQLVQAALFVGHPDHQHAQLDQRFLNWRLSTIRLAVQQIAGGHLAHPKAWALLDPTEKAQIQNLLGNVVTRLLCGVLLNTAHLVFVDVYHPIGSGKRPDFLACTLDEDYYVVEAKGRQRRMGWNKLQEVKTDQAQSGNFGQTAIKAHVVCCVHNSGGIVRAQLHDPKPKRFPVPNTASFLTYYYRPLAQLLAAAKSQQAGLKFASNTLSMAEADVEITADPVVWQALDQADYSTLLSDLKRLASAGKLGSNGLELDGVGLKLGRSWK